MQALKEDESGEAVMQTDKNLEVERPSFKRER